ncbi:MAG: DMT family transporter [Opitutaceae bacterium]|nr:DMT family transporter [Opitutaceae bacterium]
MRAACHTGVRNPAHTRAVGLLVLTALCWSLGGLLIKGVTWPPLAVAGGRGIIAALFLAATSRGLRFDFSRVQWLGAVGYAFCTVAFCVATKLTTAANAVLLQYTAPVWVALFGAWLLGERATRAEWLTIFTVLGGMTLFFADSFELTHVLGNIVGIASGIGFAGMAIALRKQKDGSPVESIILGNVLAFLIGLPWIVGAPTLATVGWISLALLGLVQLGVSYWLYARAIRHVTALEAVLIPVIEPILNPVWVLLAIGEKPTPLSLAGGIIVLSAVTWRALASIRAGRATL